MSVSVGSGVLLKMDRKAIERFCRERGISKLEVFGSVLREDFDAESDVDFLATLRMDAHPTLLDWAEMQLELEAIVGRAVDLVSKRGLVEASNEYRKQEILSTATLIYAEK